MSSPPSCGVLGVFWDIENCRVPSGKSASCVVSRIRSLDVCASNREMVFLVVCDVTKESVETVDELNTAQVTVQHVFSGRNKRNAADVKIRQAMRNFVDTHTLNMGRRRESEERSVVVVLISSDADFIADLVDFKTRPGVHVVLVHSNDASKGLIEAAHEAFEFRQIVLEVPLRYTELEVRNLPSRLEQLPCLVQDRLLALFAPFGGSVRYINDMDGCAVIKFDRAEKATSAMKGLQSTLIGCRRIHLDYNRKSSLYDKEKLKTINSRSSPRSGMTSSPRNVPRNKSDSLFTVNTKYDTDTDHIANDEYNTSVKAAHNQKTSTLVITRYLDPQSPSPRVVRQMSTMGSIQTCDSDKVAPEARQPSRMSKDLSQMKRHSHERSRHIRTYPSSAASGSTSFDQDVGDVSLLASVLKESILLCIECNAVAPIPDRKAALERHILAILKDHFIRFEGQLDLEFIHEGFRCYLRVKNLDAAAKAVTRLPTVFYGSTALKVDYVYKRQRRAGQVLENLKFETGKSSSDIMASLEDFNRGHNKLDDSFSSPLSSSSPPSSTFQLSRIVPDEGIVDIHETIVPWNGVRSSSPKNSSSTTLNQDIILPHVEVSLKNLRILIERALSEHGGSVPYKDVIQAMKSQEEIKDKIVMKVAENDRSVPVEVLIHTLEDYIFANDAKNERVLMRGRSNYSTSVNPKNMKMAKQRKLLESRLLTILESSSGYAIRENNELPEAFYAEYKERLDEAVDQHQLCSGDKVMRIGTGSNTHLTLTTQYRVTMSLPTIRKMLVKKPRHVRILEINSRSFILELEASSKRSLSDYGICNYEDFFTILSNVASNVFEISYDGLLKPSKSFTLFTNNAFSLLRDNDCYSMSALDFDQRYVSLFGFYSVLALSYGYIADLFEECVEFKAFYVDKVLHLGLSDIGILNSIEERIEKVIFNKAGVTLDKLKKLYFKSYGSMLEWSIQDLDGVESVCDLVKRICCKDVKMRKLSLLKTKINSEDDCDYVVYRAHSTLVSEIHLRTAWLLFLTSTSDYPLTDMNSLAVLYKTVFGQSSLFSEDEVEVMKESGLIVDSGNIRLAWACHQACESLQQLKNGSETPDGASLRLLRMKLPQSLTEKWDTLSTIAIALPLQLDDEALKMALTAVQTSTDVMTNIASQTSVEQTWAESEFLLDLSASSIASNPSEGRMRTKRSRLAAVFQAVNK